MEKAFSPSINKNVFFLILFFNDFFQDFHKFSIEFPFLIFSCFYIDNNHTEFSRVGIALYVATNRHFTDMSQHEKC